MADVPLTQKWLIGILTTIILGGGAAWMTSVQGDIGDLKSSDASRAATVEALKEKIEAIRISQYRQEVQLDRILERLSGAGSGKGSRTLWGDEHR